MSGDDPDFREPHLRQDDFLGAFAVLQCDGCVLMVQNERHFGGRTVLCWDLPGGQVERGERIADALVRELREETGLEVVPGEFLFVQEGVRERGGRRLYAWRSFFFAVERWRGEARRGGEVRDVRWWPLAELEPVLIAPYHDSFRAWLRERGSWFGSRWQD